MVSGESTDVSITTSKEALEFGVQAMRGPEAQHTKAFSESLIMESQATHLTATYDSQLSTSTQM
jgi:hypothetical protein